MPKQWSCFLLLFIVMSWFKVCCSSSLLMLNCWIDPPHFHRMVSILWGLCSTHNTRFGVIEFWPPSLWDRTTQDVCLFDLTVSVLADHNRLAIRDPSLLVCSIKSDWSAVIRIQAPQFLNWNQHHSHNGYAPVCSACSAAQPMPHVSHSDSSAQLNEHKLMSRETEHQLHRVPLKETSHFPYVFCPFTWVQFPMPQVLKAIP